MNDKEFEKLASTVSKKVDAFVLISREGDGLKTLSWANNELSRQALINQLKIEEQVGKMIIKERSIDYYKRLKSFGSKKKPDMSYVG